MYVRMSVCTLRMSVCMYSMYVCTVTIFMYCASTYKCIYYTYCNVILLCMFTCMNIYHYVRIFTKIHLKSIQKVFENYYQKHFVILW